MKKRFLSIAICMMALAPLSATNYQTITQQELNACYTGLEFQMPQLQVPQFPDRVTNIQDFGAIPDGRTLNTQAIQQAIDETAAQGGGTVIIPAGIWLTGPIVLKSNIRLYADYGALVQFTQDFSQYPILDRSLFEGIWTKRCQSPLSADHAENIAITGHGCFNGGGDAWRPLKKGKVTASQWRAKLAAGGVTNAKGDVWYPDEGSLLAQSYCVDQNVPVNVPDSLWERMRSFLRPVMLEFRSCKGVLLEGVTFENSPAWNLHPLLCENVILFNLNVKNPWYSQNGDGIDLECCKNTIIDACSFDVGDDAICMKSGKNEDGRRLGVPTENCIVRNCAVYHGHGGFVVGSEMSGGIKNVSVSNCLFLGTDVGLRFKSTRGRGGVVENIWVKNTNMTNIPQDGLTFDLFYGGKGAGEESPEEIAARVGAAVPAVDETTPQFRNIWIDGVTCTGSKRAIYFNGLPEMKIQNVHITNCDMTGTQGATFNQTSGLELKNVKIDCKEGQPFQFTNVDKLQSDLPCYEGHAAPTVQFESIKKTQYYKLGDRPDAYEKVDLDLQLPVSCSYDGLDIQKLRSNIMDHFYFDLSNPCSMGLYAPQAITALPDGVAKDHLYSSSYTIKSLGTYQNTLFCRFDNYSPLGNYDGVTMYGAFSLITGRAVYLSQVFTPSQIQFLEKAFSSVQSLRKYMTKNPYGKDDEALENFVITPQRNTLDDLFDYYVSKGNLYLEAFDAGAEIEFRIPLKTIK